MNPALSDKYLISEILMLKDKFNIKYFFETGSWKGYSTNIASKYFDKVYSCEINESLFSEAVENNKNNKNVELYFGSSPEVLKKLVQKHHESSIFFLDAHWYDYLPLVEELSVIRDVGIKPVILIHDFFTPNGSGGSKFGYDTYNGVPIDFNLVKNVISQIYNNEYVHYCIENSEINSGVGIITPV